MTQTCDVMILAAHPDDAEFGAAGTVARWVNEGRVVVYVICTNGDKWHLVFFRSHTGGKRHRTGIGTQKNIRFVHGHQPFVELSGGGTVALVIIYYKFNG